LFVQDASPYYDDGTFAKHELALFNQANLLDYAQVQEGDGGA